MSLKLLKNTTATVLTILAFIGALSACSSISNQNAQALQEQVYLLQTQNALLQQNGSQQANSGNQEPSVPGVPGEETPDVQFITATPESLPTEPVPAGQPIIYDNWSILVKNAIRTSENNFEISITIRNLSSKDRVFRYIMNDITITDENDSEYKFYADSYYNCEANNGIPTNITIAAGDSKELVSGYGKCGEGYGLREYQGPIAVNVHQLVVHLKNFGPFDGVKAVIDL